MSAGWREPEPIEVFFSYAHEDEELRDELEKHLSIMKRQGVITGWHDRKIGAGREWKGEIDSHLDTAHVILLLVSPDFMASAYCWDVEVKRAMERHEAGEARVIPIIMRAVDWEGAPFSKLQALPRNAKPVKTWADRDEAFLDIARGIRAAVKKLAGPKAKHASAHQLFEPEMILIPAGEFLMGSDPRKDKLARDDEQPQHTLYLPDYYIAKTPATNVQYAAFVRAIDHRLPEHWKEGKPPEDKWDHPVVYVSWYDAVAYCRWLSKVTGRRYHLPSEAEWEKAARGADGRIWPWGNEWDAKRCNSCHRGIGGTTPVGSYPEGASPYDMLDMAGNVLEWTCTLWGKDQYKPEFRYPYDPADGREVLEAPDDVLRVFRGGSWDDIREDVRCASRNWYSPNLRDDELGFRVVLSPRSP